MVIEAKRLGVSLRDAQRQALDYAMDASRQARYFTVTNGKEWMIYDTHRAAVDMLVISFDLTSGSLVEAGLNALALWRPGIVEGAVSVGRQLIGGSEEIQRQGIDQSPPRSSPTAASSAAPSPAASIREMPAAAIGASECMPLSDLNPRPRGNHPAPNEIMFPDGSSAATLGKWNKVMIEVAGWLIANGYLNGGHCPIMGSNRGVRRIVSTTPVHSNNRPFDRKR